MDFKVFDSILDCVAVINQHLEVVYANQVLADLCGVSSRRMRGGKPLTSFIDLDAPIFRGDLDIQTIEEPTLYQEIHFETVEGGVGWVQYSIQVLPRHEGMPSTWIVYMRDVTLEKNLHAKYRKELNAKEDVIVALREAQIELLAYSENLERMVEERTTDLNTAMTLQTAMLDSLGEGFLTFNQKGICQPYYSKICPDLFGMEPAGRNIVEVFHLDEPIAIKYRKWLTALFSQALPFEDVAPLTPINQTEINGRTIKIDYFPLMDEEQRLSSVVVVANDISDEIQVRRELEREKHFAFMVTKIIKYREQFVSFLEECDQKINSMLMGFPERYFDEPDLLMRELHTLRGGSATFSALALEEELNKLEDYVSHLGDLRMASVDKIAITKNLMQRLSDVYHTFVRSLEDYFKQPILNESRVVEIDFIKLIEWYDKLNRVEAAREISAEMKDKYIFEPAGKLFGHYSLVLDRIGLSSTDKKFAPLEILGGEVRVLAEDLRGLSVVLIHAIRNAADHGIETMEERQKAGKPEAGHLWLKFCREIKQGANWIKIEIGDDGRGISPQKIREVVKKRGMGVDLEGISESELINFVFLDAFTTTETMGRWSGRGAGMSAIRHEVQRLGGVVTVSSKVGQGTTLSVEVPVSKLEEELLVA